MSDRPPRRLVKHVSLPSGAIAKVTSLIGAPEVSPEDALHICGSCASSLVQRTRMERAGACHWQITLRCPSCEWSGTGVFDEAEVEALEEDLEAGSAQLVRNLLLLSDANLDAEAEIFAAEIEAFAAALESDLICPDDF